MTDKAAKKQKAQPNQQSPQQPLRKRRPDSANLKGQRPDNDPRVAAARQQNQNAAAQENDEDEEAEFSNRFLFFNALPSWLVSFLTHIAVIVILAILVLPAPRKREISIESAPGTAEKLDDIVMDLDSLELDTSDVLEQTEFEDTSARETLLIWIWTIWTWMI